MTKNKYERMLIIVFCIVFIIISILTSMIAENKLHTEHCDDTHCSICMLIHMSTNFIKSIEVVNFYILILSIIEFVMYIIRKNIQNIEKQTLVELKVIQNN